MVNVRRLARLPVEVVLADRHRQRAVGERHAVRFVALTAEQDLEVVARAEAELVRARARRSCPLFSMCMKLRRMARMKSSHECIRPTIRYVSDGCDARVPVDVVGVGPAPLQDEVVLALEHRRTRVLVRERPLQPARPSAARGGAALRGRRLGRAGNGGDVIARPSSSSRATNSCHARRGRVTTFPHEIVSSGTEKCRW